MTTHITTDDHGRMCGERPEYNDRLLVVYRDGDVFDDAAWAIKGPTPNGADGWQATCRRHLAADVLPKGFWLAATATAIDGGWAFVAEVADQ